MQVRARAPLALKKRAFRRDGQARSSPCATTTTARRSPGQAAARRGAMPLADSARSIERPRHRPRVSSLASTPVHTGPHGRRSRARNGAMRKPPFGADPLRVVAGCTPNSATGRVPRPPGPPRALEHAAGPRGRAHVADARARPLASDPRLRRGRCAPATRAPRRHQEVPARVSLAWELELEAWPRLVALHRQLLAGAEPSGPPDPPCVNRGTGWLFRRCAPSAPRPGRRVVAGARARSTPSARTRARRCDPRRFCAGGRAARGVRGGVARRRAPPGARRGAGRRADGNVAPRGIAPEPHRVGGSAGVGAAARRGRPHGRSHPAAARGGAAVLQADGAELSRMRPMVSRYGEGDLFARHCDNHCSDGRGPYCVDVPPLGRLLHARGRRRVARGRQNGCLRVYRPQADPDDGRHRRRRRRRRRRRGGRHRAARRRAPALFLRLPRAARSAARPPRLFRAARAGTLGRARCSGHPRTSSRKP